MGLVTCHHWCFRAGNVFGPSPSRIKQHEMLVELADFLRATGSRPVRVTCESWPRVASVDPAIKGDYLASIRLEFEPDVTFDDNLAAWFQWQHPQWRWSQDEFPWRISARAVPA